MLLKLLERVDVEGVVFAGIHGLALVLLETKITYYNTIRLAIIHNRYKYRMPQLELYKLNIGPPPPS